MKIPPEIRKKFLLKQDPEAEFFLDFFDEKAGLRALEVGANDNHLAVMLVECGFPVHGVDLMKYSMPYGYWNEKSGGAWYTHWIGDFCKQAEFAEDFKKQRGWSGGFDLIYSISAIEHFGLNTYGEGTYKPYYDVIAMRYIYDLLAPGGVVYISVPIGGRYVQYGNHWRVYSLEAIHTRLMQDFEQEWIRMRIVEWDHPKCGETPDQSYIQSLVNGEPYVSCLMKLRKPK